MIIGFRKHWILRGIREYEFIYKNTVEQDVMEILNRAKADEPSIEQIKQYLYNAMEQSSIHFGQTYPNPATIAGACRMLVKPVAKAHGVRFPISEESEKE